MRGNVVLAGAAVLLVLAGTALAQQDDGKGAGNYEALNNGQGMPLPDISGMQQQMQAQMMQQMTKQMQSATPAAGQQPAAAVQGMAPDVSGMQQQMQARMMQQMSQQMQSASPAAQANPDPMMQQNMQAQLQKVVGIDPAAKPEPSSGGLQLDAAISSLKMDPAVQATLNEKMRTIMEQTMRETFADPKMRQEMQQRFQLNGTAPSTGQVKQQP